MHAVIATPSDPYIHIAGTQRMVLHTKNFLEEEGFKVDIVHKDNSQKFGDYFPLWVGREAYLRCDKCDLVIANNIAGLGLFPGRAKRLVAMFHGLYLGFFGLMHETKAMDFKTMTFLGYLHNKYINGYIAEVFLANAADRIVAVSEHVKKEIEQHIGVDKDITVVNNPVDDIFKPMDKSKVRAMFNIPEDAFVGLFIGRNETPKGYDIFRQVVNYTYRDVFWVQVFSRGSLDNLPILEDITTFRHVPFGDMPLIYNMADFVLFPSRYEGFPLTIVEALACGVPVVASKLAVPIEVEDYLKDLVVEQMKADEFVEKIMLIKNHRWLREYYREVISEKVSRRFSLESWKEKMKKAILL
ncbi:glycosyltransferase family 4 protein [Hydrogenobacter thermophilus]|uniref:glycosyltransferase family 4 protein n=1 Tax=Hydrogenobacter thermophilus TaxID=940 RepID=UPI0030F71061